MKTLYEIVCELEDYQNENTEDLDFGTYQAIDILVSKLLVLSHLELGSTFESLKTEYINEAKEFIRIN